MHRNIEKPHALAFLDFEKAFDSVDHTFTFEMLNAVKVPHEFIQWAKLAFTDTTTCVIVNGKRSESFQLPTHFLKNRKKI